MMQKVKILYSVRAEILRLLQTHMDHEVKQLLGVSLSVIRAVEREARGTTRKQQQARAKRAATSEAVAKREFERRVKQLKYKAMVERERAIRANARKKGLI